MASKDPLARLAEQQNIIPESLEIAAQDAVRAVLGGDGPGGRKFREILHGTWLHEPLHAVMTDVPVGSWTAAVLFDAIGALAGSETMDKAADALVILGLVGAGGRGNHRDERLVGDQGCGSAKDRGGACPGKHRGDGDLRGVLHHAPEGQRAILRAGSGSDRPDRCVSLGASRRQPDL